MNIEIEVKDQHLTAKNPRNMVAGTAGLTTFTASFDESWENLKKTLLFESVGSGGQRQTVALLLDGSEGQVPWEVLERPGTLWISAVGVSDDGVRCPTAIMAGPLYIVQSGATVGSPAGERTPELWEQAVVEAKTAADSAVQSATSASQAATNAAKAVEMAQTAASNAQDAAETAREAAAGAEKVNIRAEQTQTGATITVTDRTGAETAIHINMFAEVNTWADVQTAIRLGLGPKLFPVGYEFTTRDSDTDQDIIWVVRGHDHHKPASSRLTHSMTLEMKYLYSNESGRYRGVQYDEKEALYYAEGELPAGTYHFTVSSRLLYQADNGKTFQFTLTKPVPAGGQIVVLATYNQTLAGKNVRTYQSPSSTAVLETTTIDEGSAGTNLGVSDGAGNVNHFHRIDQGSNNYAQSAVRQWLNSNAESGDVWTPQTKFDRPPTWVTTYNGFLHGLPDDFLSVVEASVIPCRTNNVYECSSLDGTTFQIGEAYTVADKFFLLSRPEIFGTAESDNVKDGEILEYYDGPTGLIWPGHDNIGTRTVRYTRSPITDSMNYVCTISAFGEPSDKYSAYNSYGVTPACIIA